MTEIQTISPTSRFSIFSEPIFHLCRLVDNGGKVGLDIMQLHLGDCYDILKTLPDNSVDSIVTDPPYGINFMNKKWDYDVPDKKIWKQCLRVLKHGGHLLAFSGTRTYHRMVVEIEDAGFTVKDQIQWLYGSGFPKSQSISKNIDKESGRYVEGDVLPSSRKVKGPSGFHMKKKTAENPQTEESKQWKGWGTHLKPANEPICLAQKPISGKTIVGNVLEHGTGALNIDGCRVGIEGGTSRINGSNAGKPRNTLHGGNFGVQDINKGRFPANVIMDEEAGAILDEQAPNVGNMMNTTRKKTTTGGTGNAWTTSSKNEGDSNGIFDGLGGASRFFYQAKASKSERSAGLTQNENFHPTVKPVDLMRYLCRLITPPNGTVLDPFMGSGSTGIGAILEGFDFIGIEMDEKYLKIAETRIKAWKKSAGKPKKYRGRHDDVKKETSDILKRVEKVSKWNTSTNLDDW